MKILIVYSSITGNTQKLAEAIYGVLGGEKTLCAIDEAPSPLGYDLIALGFWLQAGKPDHKAQKYLSEIKNGSRLFLFATHGAAADSQHARQVMGQALILVPEAKIMGSFSCCGQVSPTFLEAARKKDPPPPWIVDAPGAVGHPDDADIARLTGTVKTALTEFLA